MRRYVQEKYGTDAGYEDGLKIFTAVNPALQMAAQREIVSKMAQYDRRRQFQGPEARWSIEKVRRFQKRIDGLPRKPVIIGDHYEGVVTRVDPKDEIVEMLFGREVGWVDADGMRWAEKGGWEPAIGDVIHACVEKALAKDQINGWRLTVVPPPKAEAALVCIETGTGFVKAMVGGAAAIFTTASSTGRCRPDGRRARHSNRWCMQQPWTTDSCPYVWTVEVEMHVGWVALHAYRGIVGSSRFLSTVMKGFLSFADKVVKRNSRNQYLPEKSATVSKNDPQKIHIKEEDMNYKGNTTIFAFAIVAALLVFTPISFGKTSTIDLNPTNKHPNATGSAVIDSEHISIQARGLEPDSVYTVWFVNTTPKKHETGAGTPPFMFRTNQWGDGFYSASLEGSPFANWQMVMIVLHPDGDPKNMKNMVGALTAKL